MPVDPQAGTNAADPAAKAREVFRSQFEELVDPGGTLPPDERARRADEARREHYAEMGRKSGRARRERSEQVSELLHRTRTERGMALVIDDPAIIAKVAAIVAAGEVTADAS